MDFPLLETNRLKLVEITEKYAEEFFDIMSKDVVLKYYGMDKLKSLEEALKIIHSFRIQFDTKRGIRWGIILKETGEFVGTIGLNNLNLLSKRAEIGFELHPSYWGKGIMSNAVREILGYSFIELGLHRIGAVTYPQNKASIKLLRRFGFTLEGLLRGYIFQNNKPHDAFMFSLLQPEWVKEQKILVKIKR